MLNTAADLYDDRGVKSVITDIFSQQASLENNMHAKHGAVSANDEIFDELNLNPYTRTLKQRVFAKIENGTSTGEIFDFVIKSTEGMERNYTAELLAELRDTFQEYGQNDLAGQINDHLLLSYADLGLGIEFFNTGPNSNGGVDMPTVKINRYHIEAHKETQRFKPSEDQAVPFLGVG